MTDSNAFTPKWTTPPGATALDLLCERHLPISDLARAAHTDLHRVSRFLYGLEPLTPEWADCLSKVLGSTPAFWLRREELYRADLKRLCSAGLDHGVDEWLRDIPLNDMVRFGWIVRGSSPEETALNACAYFGVTTGKAFDRKYEELLRASVYRTSFAAATRPSAVVAWLRQGEIEATGIDCTRWNEDKLRSTLDDIRVLTREKDPKKFLPEVRRLLAGCGTAFVTVRAPDGCRASGATRFVSPQKALVQLSFRYLADDQFWFTLFHELGHLLLHAHEKLFLEGLERRNSKAETEANTFARDALFAKVGTGALDQVRTSAYDIARLARRAGIAPGIVVGQLQEMGRIPFRHFNYMKARYTWSS